MHLRKINPLLVLFSLIGGAAGYFTGEAVLAWGEGLVPNAWLIGIYFGQFALWVALFCLLAEQVSPVLNGDGWKLRYVRDSWKMLLPASLVLLFLAGTGLQFLYGLSFGKNHPPQDILLAIDISGSMSTTDPNRERFNAATELVDKLEPDKRVAIVTFNHQASLLQSLVPVSDQAMKDGVKSKLAEVGPPDGETDIGAALQLAMQQIQAAASDNRKSMVILLSDGYSEVMLDQALQPYRLSQIAINTVGMNVQDEQGNDLLRKIAGRTGGTFHKVDEVQNLNAVVAKIYKANQSWHMLGERTGAYIDSSYYMILRILFIVIIGVLLGLSLGIVFDNRFLAKAFSIGGGIGGLLAGLILELGIKDFSYTPSVYRAAADMVLVLILALSTGMIAFKQSSSADQSQGFYSRNRRGADRNTGSQQGTHRGFR